MFHKVKPEIDNTTMAMMGSIDHSRGNFQDLYQTSQSGGLSPGFFTPPSSYEGRRDSISSSESSMSSFAGYASDYSMPVTPVSRRTPLFDDTFVDTMSYDLSPDFRTQSLHGLPVAPQQKAFAAEEISHGWAMVSPVEQTPDPSMLFRPHDMLSMAGDFNTVLQVHMGNPLNMHGASSGPSWDNISTMVYAGTASYKDSPSVENFWTNQVQQPQGASTQTIMPSDAMLDVDDYFHVHSDSFQGVDTFETAGASFPRSPQEVCFKKEDQVPVKLELDTDEEEGRFKRSIIVLPTGGKSVTSVKKERRSGGVSKKSKMTKHKQFAVDFPGHNLRESLKREGIVKNRVTGKWENTDGQEQKRHFCKVEIDGHECGKPFRRPEHLKRHVQTHTGVRGYHCRICTKPFGRNDNCQEHYWTHVKRPGKKNGTNVKMSLQEVEECVGEEKVVEKLRQKWKSEMEKVCSVRA